MVANTGTLVDQPRWIPGQTCTVHGYGTFAGTAASADTLTISDMVPTNGFIVTEVSIYGDDLDADASPTATLSMGDGTDVDFYSTAKVAAAITDTGQMIHKGDGVGLTTSSGTAPASADVVLTIAGTMATGASAAVVHVSITYTCDDAA